VRPGSKAFAGGVVAVRTQFAGMSCLPSSAPSFASTMPNRA
jgi:hypothetical protein